MKPISKWPIIMIVLSGALLALVTGITRSVVGQNPGLALVVAGILFPMTILLISSHRTLLIKLRTYLTLTSFNKSILHFTCLFWYLGTLFIISYQLYENFTTYFPSFFAGGLLGGYLLRRFLGVKFK